jgi:hypothetical protein
MKQRADYTTLLRARSPSRSVWLRVVNQSIVASTASSRMSASQNDLDTNALTRSPGPGSVGRHQAQKETKMGTCIVSNGPNPGAVIPITLGSPITVALGRCSQRCNTAWQAQSRLQADTQLVGKVLNLEVIACPLASLHQIMKENCILIRS